MSKIELPEAFPIEEAQEWIARWKAAGGGFFCHIQPCGEQVLVQLAFEAPAGVAQPPAVDAISNELLGKPDLKSAVVTLVAEAWAAQRRMDALATTEVAGHA